jgi:hypothetical protein
MLAIDFAEPEPSDDVAEYRDSMRQSNDAFLSAIRSAMGSHWPCGHQRSEDNTHTIGASAQCKKCRREEINSAVRTIAQRQAVERALAIHAAEIEARRIERRKDEKAREVECYQREREEKRRLRDQANRKANEIRAAVVECTIIHPANGRIPFHDLIEGVASAFGLTADGVRSKARGKEFIYARCVMVKILQERGASYPVIGRLLGGRDHSTTINAYLMFPTYCRKDPRVASTYEKFKDR